MRRALLALTGLFLVAGLGTAMRLPGMPYHDGGAAIEAGPRAHAPLAELRDGLQAAFEAGDLAPLWEVRLWYPWLLAPLWLLALLLGGRRDGDGVRRRVAGGLLLLVTAGLVVLEGVYLASDYEALLPPPFGDVEAVVAFVAVLFVLLARRAPDRRVGAVEGHVGAQALLSFLHLLTLPGTFARRWYLAGADSRAIAARLLDGFPPPFVTAQACLLALGLVVLLRPARDPRRAGSHPHPELAEV